VSDRGALRSSVAAARSALRSLRLLFRDSPKTPLRVLCIAALDTAHVLRHARQMPRARVNALAEFLDFGACLNAEWDQKPLRDCRQADSRRRLDADGLGPLITQYLARLRGLERGRPSIGGDHRQFDAVRAYRENVVRLSLATAAAIAMNSSLEHEIAATDRDSDLEVLFRIIMQCQVMDDVLDYREDQSRGLPSFLTSVASLQQAAVMTAGTARAYGGQWERSSVPSALPFRLALRLVTILTKLVVHVAPPPLLRYPWFRARTAAMRATGVNE
jgi:hypothetical protein